jgi:hypothetical protein
LRENTPVKVLTREARSDWLDNLGIEMDESDDGTISRVG